MMPSSVNVFDIKRFACHDGKGIRTTIFLKGCPLRCAWCQNPEGLSVKSQVLYLENKCIHCQSCVHACVRGGIRFVDGKILVDRSVQEDWPSIVDVCPCKALQMDSQSMSIDDVMEEILKDEIFFRNGGGVTFSGGEPLLQADVLVELLKHCKEKGLHTAIETSLYANEDVVDSVMKYIDQIYMDIKVFDGTLHQKLTGVSNETILANAKRLLESDKQDHIIVRTPLIPTLSATDENISAIAQFISNIYPGVRYEMLNYNPLAKAKYAYLDQEYCFCDNPKLYTKTQMDHFYDVAGQYVKNLIRE